LQGTALADRAGWSREHGCRKPHDDLKGQVALVTGASRGIAGRSLSRSRAGATVVGTATTEAGAQTITAYLAEAGIRARERSSTSGSREHRNSGVRIEEAHGRCPFSSTTRALPGQPRHAHEEAEWDAVIDTNLKSVFRLSKAGCAA